MSRKVRVKQLKKAVDGGENINGMFEEMMGMKDAEPELIIPKFVAVRNLVRKVYKVLLQFSTFGPLREDFPEYTEALDEIKTFTTDLQASIYFNVDQDDQEEQYRQLDKTEINSLYKKLKENEYVKRLIVLCGRLKQYNKYIGDQNNLRDNFIGQEPGLSFVIFDFSTFDLKKMWVHDKIKPMVKKYILNILCNLYRDTFEIYKITTSPDVDIDKFTELLISSLQKLKNQPGLSRCNNAFRRIERSVELLKEKFNDYYRESVASSNPNMIVESFIIDVSNQGGADANLTREFRQIIQYMHKVSAQTGKNKDPNVQKLFKMLQTNFNALERQTGRVADPDEKTDEDIDISLKEPGAETSNKTDAERTIPEKPLDIITSDPKTTKKPAKKKPAKKKPVDVLPKVVEQPETQQDTQEPESE